MISTKEREKIWFEIFCEKYPLYPDKDTVEFSDSPDVIFELDGLKLGLEITELYRNENMRQQEAIKELICKSNENLCEKYNLPPCDVDIWLSDGISKNREKLLVTELFDIVNNNIPPVNSSIDIDHNHYDILPPEVEYLSIYRYENYQKKHSWTFAQVVENGTSFSDLLRKAIDKKNVRYKKYCSKVDSCWLLITTIGNRGSSTFEFNCDMKNIKYQTHFKKVFFLNGFGNKINELNVISIDGKM